MLGKEMCGVRNSRRGGTAQRRQRNGGACTVVMRAQCGALRSRSRSDNGARTLHERVSERSALARHNARRTAISLTRFVDGVFGASARARAQGTHP